MVEKNCEIEMKFPFPSYGKEELLRRLIEIGTIMEGKAFEENIIFDTDNNTLTNEGLILRIRKYKDKNTITFKGKIQKDSKFKIREEIEAEVSDFDNMVLIFDRLGFNANIIYQKYRQNFVIGNVSLSIDELPFGTYIEIEGTKEEINTLIDKLELETTEISAMGYLELYYKYCEEKHIPATGKITFTDKEQ